MCLICKINIFEQKKNGKIDKWMHVNKPKEHKYKKKKNNNRAEKWWYDKILYEIIRKWEREWNKTDLISTCESNQHINAEALTNVYMQIIHKIDKYAAYSIK